MKNKISKILYGLMLATLLSPLVTGCWWVKKEDFDSLQNQVEYMNSRLKVMDELLKAVKERMYIASITSRDDGGYCVEMSNGKVLEILQDDILSGQTILDVTIADAYVSFTLVDKSVITLPLYSPLSITFTLPDDGVVPVPLGRMVEVPYLIASTSSEVRIEALSSADLKADAIPDKKNPLKGVIKISSVGQPIDEYSKVVVIVSNDEKTIIRRLSFEDYKIEVNDDTIIRVSSGACEVKLNFLSNIPCSASFNKQDKYWINIPKPYTKAAMQDHSITVQLKGNYGAERTGIITVGSEGTCVDYTIIQEKGYESTDYSRDGECITLQRATLATEEYYPHIVFIGVGWTDRDIASGEYEKRVRSYTESFFEIEPFKSFRDYLSVSAIVAVSKNHGLAHKSTLDKTTYTYSFDVDNGFGLWTDGAGSVWDGYFYPDKLPEKNSHKISSNALDIVYDYYLDFLENETGGIYIVFVLNDEQTIGESNYYDKVVYMGNCKGDQRLIKVLLAHELGGHVLGGLKDEYYGPFTYKGEGWWDYGFNLTIESDPEKVPWAPMIASGRYPEDDCCVVEGGMANFNKGIWRSSYVSAMSFSTNATTSYNPWSRYLVWKRIRYLAIDRNIKCYNRDNPCDELEAFFEFEDSCTAAEQ